MSRWDTVCSNPDLEWVIRSRGWLDGGRRGDSWWRWRRHRWWQRTWRCSWEIRLQLINTASQRLQQLQQPSSHPRAISNSSTSNGVTLTSKMNQPRFVPEWRTNSVVNNSTNSPNVNTYSLSGVLHNAHCIVQCSYYEAAQYENIKDSRNVLQQTSHV